MATEPHDEGRAVWLVHLLLRQGRRASARAVIEAIQTELDDMGLAPTPELSQLRATVVAARVHA